jgi:hypothetical protein
VKTESEAFKVWRNPTGPGEAPVYLGEFYPPAGQVCIFASDLKILGVHPGHYTIRVPNSLRERYALPPWQEVEIP